MEAEKKSDQASIARTSMNDDRVAWKSECSRMTFGAPPTVHSVRVCMCECMSQYNTDMVRKYSATCDKQQCLRDDEARCKLMLSKREAKDTLRCEQHSEILLIFQKNLNFSRADFPPPPPPPGIENS